MTTTTRLLTSGQRRALSDALGSTRCPTCNRAGLWISPGTHHRQALCNSCGATANLFVVYTIITSRSGIRHHATITADPA